jgi:hypothetical protein
MELAYLELALGLGHCIVENVENAQRSVDINKIDKFEETSLHRTICSQDSGELFKVWYKHPLLYSCSLKPSCGASPAKSFSSNIA